MVLSAKQVTRDTQYDGDFVLEQIGPGVLILVVGPSGSGKDTLLRGAARRLSGDPKIVFPRRAITRASNPEHEDHDTISFAQFEELQVAENAALYWEAHGQGYVIPKEIIDDVRSGKTIIFNSSRSIIHTAVQRYQNVGIIHISVPDHVLASRIANRGREQGAEIQSRLARAPFELPSDINLINVHNTGPVDDGIQKFVEAIKVFTAV